MQLFSPWGPDNLEDWKNPESCIDEFNKRREVILKVRKKTFPFGMNEITKEVKLQEGLDHIADEITDMFDGQGIQNDLDALEEGSQETSRPVIDFSEWNDDINNPTNGNKRNNDSRFRPVELQTHEQLLEAKYKISSPRANGCLAKGLGFCKNFSSM